jgi:adenine deaminase
MLLAVLEIKRVNGGYTLVSGGKVLDTLELPIAGLMSDQPAEYVVAKLKAILRKAYQLGINPDIDPFITLSFLALPVIPEIRVTDQGLFDVTEFKFIEI